MLKIDRETAEQLDLLRELGCDVVQGHLLPLPTGPEQVVRLLERAALPGLPAPRAAPVDVQRIVLP